MQLGLMYPVRSSKALGSLSQLKIIKQNSLTKVSQENIHQRLVSEKKVKKWKEGNAHLFGYFSGHGESNFPCSVVQSETGPTG